MPERLNTTETSGESDVWSPATDEVIQLGGVEGSRATVEIFGRVHADAPWASVGSARVSSHAFISVIKLPYLKLKWVGNRNGDQLKAWSI